MNDHLLKKTIYFILIILIAVLCYKIYLIFHEEDYKERNFDNIQKIEALSKTDQYSFAVMGSAENSIDVFQNKIIDNINNSDALFLISTGDAVLDGAEDKYRILNQMLNHLDIPSVIGVGTNEISDGGNMRYYKHFGPFYDDFVYGDSFFIFIDTTGTTSYDLQENWLNNELATADQYDHIFVFMDRSPLYEYADKSSELSLIKNNDFSNYLIDSFSHYDVDAVFTNGSGFYNRVIGGVPYYSSGGVGGLLLNNSVDDDFHYLNIEVNGDRVNVSVIKEDITLNHTIFKNIQNVWFYFHSIFYIQFTNLIIILCVIFLIVYIFYKKFSKNVDYYRDFSIDSEKIVVPGKLNIAMFTNNYLPFVGGVPISISRLARALIDRGHQVTVFAPEYPNNHVKEDHVIRCKLMHYRKTGNFHFAIANIFLKHIDRYFNDGNFDIVHVHHPFWLGKKGLKLGQKKKIPVVLTYHTRLELYSKNLPFGRTIFKKYISHKLIKTFAQKCDGVIAPTTSAAEYLSNIGVSRDKLVLPTGIDLEPYLKTDQEEVNSLRRNYVKEDEILLCSVSRLSIEKNLDFMIEGLEILKGCTKKRFKCLLIGEGPEKENLQKLIDEKGMHTEIILTGAVPQTCIPHYYLASDIFVFSSLSETQGMVLLEAMAGKCPVVCVRSSGTDDVVVDGCNGFKTAESIEEWAEKINLLVTDKKQLQLMSTNAFELAQEFSIKKMAEKVESFYKNLILQKRLMKR